MTARGTPRAAVLAVCAALLVGCGAASGGGSASGSASVTVAEASNGASIPSTGSAEVSTGQTVDDVSPDAEAPAGTTPPTTPPTAPTTTPPTAPTTTPPTAPTTTTVKPNACGTPPTGTEGGKLTQRIVFSVPAQMYPDTSFTLKACATSGLPVQFTTQPSPLGKCSLAGGVFTVKWALGGETCEVTAGQPGDATYAAAPEVTVPVVLDLQVITLTWVVPPPAQLKVGSSATLRLGLRSPSSPIPLPKVALWVSQGSCTAAGRQESQTAVSVVLTATTAGDCEVSVSVSGDQYVAGKEATPYTVHVVSP